MSSANQRLEGTPSERACSSLSASTRRPSAALLAQYAFRREQAHPHRN